MQNGPLTFNITGQIDNTGILIQKFLQFYTSLLRWYHLYVKHKNLNIIGSIQVINVKHTGLIGTRHILLT